MWSQTLVPTVSLKRVFPGYPPTMQGTQMVPLYHLCLVPVSSNETLQHTQAGLVPTWSLYNTHGVAHSCTHSLPKTQVFQGHPPTLQGIHMTPLHHPWVAHLCLAPISSNKAVPHPPKHLFLVPPGLLPKVSL